MTTTNWTGKAGTMDFGNAGNWDNGVPDATVDTSIVGVDGSALTVIYSSGTNSTRSLTTEFANLTVSGGSLTILAGAELGGNLSQTGGTLTLDGMQPLQEASIRPTARSRSVRAAICPCPLRPSSVRSVPVRSTARARCPPEAPPRSRRACSSAAG
jgi:hypothetical protein